MGSIKRFFDQEIVVRRYRESGTRQHAYQATATVDGHVQNLDTRTRNRLGIIGERSWHAWFSIDADIKEDDQITDEYGTVYNVREVTKRHYGINKHLEIIMEEQSG